MRDRKRVRKKKAIKIFLNVIISNDIKTKKAALKTHIYLFIYIYIYITIFKIKKPKAFLYVKFYSKQLK